MNINDQYLTPDERARKATPANFPDGTFSSPEALAKFTGAPPTRGKYDSRSVRSGQPLGAYDGSASQRGIGSSGVYNREAVAPTSYQLPPEQPTNLNPNGFPVYPGFKEPPQYRANSGANWTKDAFDRMNEVSKYREALAQQEALRKSGAVKSGVDEYGNPQYRYAAPKGIRKDPVLRATEERPKSSVIPKPMSNNKVSPVKPKPLDKLDQLTQDTKLDQLTQDTRDIYGNKVKLDDILIRGGMGGKQGSNSGSAPGMQFRMINDRIVAIKPDPASASDPDGNSILMGSKSGSRRPKTEIRNGMLYSDFGGQTGGKMSLVSPLKRESGMR